MIFRISLAHNSLEAYFDTNFALIQHHKYSLGELENLMPWERDVYVSLLSNWIKQENERKRERNKNV